MTTMLPLTMIMCRPALQISGTLRYHCSLRNGTWMPP